MNRENLGPAERIINTILTHADHLHHGRPGVVTKDPTSATGVKWAFAKTKKREEDGKREVFLVEKVGKKSVPRRIGLLGEQNRVVADNGTVLGEYRSPGIFPEVAEWTYRQVAEVWKLDNEFAARWASYAYVQDHKDLKVVLAAFMLSQSRKGDPVRGDEEVPIVENGIIIGKKKPIMFFDEDFRDVGEAMCLTYRKDGKSLDPRLLFRIHRLLTLPQIVAINLELGFTKSVRNPHVRRWGKAVHKWLHFRENNPRLLQGLVKAGHKGTVMDLAQVSHFKPDTEEFYSSLRWKQVQAKDGRRQIAIGNAVSAAESLEGMNEQQVCEWIEANKPSFKKVVSLVPKAVGVTRAVMTAAIEAGSLSNKDLIIATPTLEELGLLDAADKSGVRDRWEKATRMAEDTRAANIATRVKGKGVQEKLQDAADTAMKEALKQTVRGLRVYFMIDRSGSMEGAIEAAKSHLAKFLQGFPLDQIHVVAFNTVARDIVIRHPSAAGVENAFSGVKAGGGTHHGNAVLQVQGYRPKPEEDVLFVFIGDENEDKTFEHEVRISGLNPMAFGLIPVTTPQFGRGSAVSRTAQQLGIPCFEVDAAVFADPYAIPRTIRNLVAATPVNRAQRPVPAIRETLIDVILKTEIMRKPSWAG